MHSVLPSPAQRLVALVLLVALIVPVNAEPWKERTVSIETGLLWQVGDGTPLSYRLVPTQLSLRLPAHINWEGERVRLVVRPRFTLLGTFVQQGPESHYIAVAASPSFELWNKAGTWAAYSGLGGGAGFLDSQGVVGGQGQDFTLHWFARAGLERVISERMRWSAGVLFQHMSNGGQTEPNPGIDAVGFMVGGTWTF